MKAIMKAKNLKILVDATKHFLAGRDCKPCFQYIRLEFDRDHRTVTAVGADAHRFSVEHSTAEYIDESFVAYIKPDMPKCKSKACATIELSDKRCTIQIGEKFTEYEQPIDEYLEYKYFLQKLEDEPVRYSIAFNPELLMDALRSAKVSNTGLTREHVILEFRSPLKPIILKTGRNGESIKAVMPMRVKRGK